MHAFRRWVDGEVWGGAKLDTDDAVGQPSVLHTRMLSRHDSAGGISRLNALFIFWPKYPSLLELGSIER